MDNAQPTPPQPFGSPIPGPTATAPPDKFPVGLLFIVIWVGVAVLLSVRQLFDPACVIGTLALTGPPAVLYALVQLAVYAALFIWLIQRRNRGRILGIITSVYSILFMVFGLTMLSLRPDEVMDAWIVFDQSFADDTLFEGFVVLFGLLGLLICMVESVVIAYLVLKKRYFRS